MSGKDCKDFDDRLAELSNWQIEQQKKLKEFQEAQRRLLDLEHRKVLSSFRTQNFDQRDHNKENDCLLQKLNTSGGWDDQLIKSRDSNDVFQLKYPALKLNEPKSSIFNSKCSLNEEKACRESSELINKGRPEPKKFLRRGEGLARFRMTFDDFKGAPKIYKEKKIKTYLDSKSENSLRSSRSSKSSKNCIKVSKNSQTRTSSKPMALPVKIYVPENKAKKCNTTRYSESVIPKKTSELSKTAVQELALKPCKIATEWYNIMKEKEKVELVNEKCREVGSQDPDASELDVDRKKDEKELQIFEFLEKKLDDSSFCSTSSLVEKFMEHSLSSTPSKLFTNECHKKSYVEGLKSLQSQFLNEEQIRRFDELSDILSEDIPDVGTEKNDVDDVKESNFKSEGIETEIKEIGPEPEPEPEPHKVNKTVLQEYIKDFKKLKNILAENAYKVEESENQSIQESQVKKQVQNNQQEIALKLRRKGLQDNVKQLLNWECPSRKKPPKRILKKTKLKSTRTEKLKPAEKEQSEKVIFSSSLLKTKLEELEKEIEIFRRENKNLEKLQKECNEERIRLAKERKEFEKQMQEEKEKFELKIAEEQKKLQKERTVFEKYCKTVKNQPSRQEREETANLKKEIERLTEALTTKESRWGASQARLRNQLKNLEKENAQLKEEIEKCKKQISKKVSFENEKNINAKIINVINSELQKLKPTIVKSAAGKEEPQSARTERQVERKPIRRIKSVPNIKKQDVVNECTEASNEFDEKGLGSVSTDSGIETNGTRCTRLVETVDCEEGEKARAMSPELEGEDSARSQEFKGYGECFARRFVDESTGDRFESAIHEAIFGYTSTETTQTKISEIKNRLQRLTGLHSETFPEKTVRLQPLTNSKNRQIEEVILSSEEEEDESGENELGISNYWRKDYQNKRDVQRNGHALVESRLEESGIWEKVYEDGSKEINYPNGNVKKIFPGNKIVKMVFYNGDVKETNVIEGSEKYYYAETKTWHTTYKDGLEVLEFPNGQTERRHADGSTEISFPNGCVRYCDSSGRDEWRFLDGTVIKTNESGHKILLMPNGQKEIHTKEYKRREYPDGTVKILYADGTQETRYASGRVRLKDKDGNLVMDSGGIR